MKYADGDKCNQGNPMGLISGMFRWMVVLPLALATSVQAMAQDAKPFSKEQLDQMTAQIALYPDSLLSQLLMATTYPDEFAKAYAWSKAHPDAKGDDAVKMVENESWDPSVASMVGFPEVLITLGEKTDWVKNMGDAFLAQPDDVMDSVQRLRAQAQKAGNLKSNEQVKVSTEAAPPPAQPDDHRRAAVGAAAAGDRHRAGAAVGRVRARVQPGGRLRRRGPIRRIRRTTIPTPPGYWFSRTVATGIAWGVGIGVANALWGGFNWGRGDVNINVNRYNNINVNNRIDANSNRTTWNHNSAASQTSDYRGRQRRRARTSTASTSPAIASSTAAATRASASRDASRERASQTMQNRGMQSPTGSARDRAQTMNRDASSGQARRRRQPRRRAAASAERRPRRGAPAVAVGQSRQCIARRQQRPGACAGRPRRVELPGGAAQRRRWRRARQHAPAAEAVARRRAVAAGVVAGAAGGGGGGGRGGGGGGGGRR